MPVRVNPGHSTWTRTPVDCSSNSSALVKPTRKALVPEYVTLPPDGTSPPMEETLTIAPCPRVSICGRTARHSRTGASTCTWTMARCRSAVTVTNEPAVTNPAALTRKLMSGSASMRAHRRSSCLASARSVWKTSARAPDPASTSAASASSRSVRRATRTRPYPSAASRRANAAPIPLDAPVTVAVDTGQLASVGIGVHAGHAGPRAASGGWEHRHEASPFVDAHQPGGVSKRPVSLDVGYLGGRVCIHPNHRRAHRLLGWREMENAQGEALGDH